LGFSPNTNDQVEVLEIMHAFDPEVANALWVAVEPLIPVAPDRHPLGCHRPRKSDRACFEVILVRLVTGCSWEDAEHLTGRMVSDTTARERRDEWIGAGGL
jgi:transposase